MESVINIALFLFGVFVGYCIKTVRYYSYVPPNLSHRYTYNEILKFVGGKPVRKKGAICGSRRIAIIIDERVNRMDNTINFKGSFHRPCSPANPGHQSINYSVNKKINETRDHIYIFVKIRSNEYAFIGTGLRNGRYYTVEKSSREILVFPIRYMSGNLERVIRVLENEIEHSNNSSGSD